MRLDRRIFLAQSACCAAALAARRSLALPYEPVASLVSGRVRGALDHGLIVFKGIPYGADTAPHRFMPPLPPTPWTGVRDALDFGPRAPQPTGRGFGNGHGFYLPPESGPVSEDCLHLNVWTPALRDGRRRPVLVYIHGGGYNGWSANSDLYSGVNLCRRGDAVVVTLNHRLNLFGYLYLSGLSAGFEDSGNAGMLDLVLALQWVRDNIEAFGGDPRRVLIFGQSGGGAKCATLMAMPAAHGLFHRVLTMSGQQLTASRPESATPRAESVLKTLGLTPATINDIRTLPMDRLIQAARASTYFGPVKDGRSLPRDPFAPDAPPISAGVPMILGNTHDETRGFFPSDEYFSLTWESLPGRIEQVAQFLGALDRSQIVAQFRSVHPDYSPSNIFFAITTAFRSWRGQVIEAERRAAQPPAQPHTWVYELDWFTPIDGGKWRAPHTLDIPLWFDNTALAPGMTGDGPEARSVAAQMSETLLAFASTGNPNHPGLPHWAPYDLKNRPTMSFAAPSRLVSDPRGAERRIVEQVPYTQPGT
ncbi:MAG: carboxylesterase family protein [Terracidiphilus sp.]|nr:carboxylesterase family protein [Terracidiphilus sp.]